MRLLVRYNSTAIDKTVTVKNKYPIRLRAFSPEKLILFMPDTQENIIISKEDLISVEAVE